MRRATTSFSSVYYAKFTDTKSSRIIFLELFYIFEQLSGLAVRVRKMFGEYALYCDEKLPAFICNDTLYVKILDANETLAAGLAKGPCYPGSKDYYVVPAERLEDRAWLKSLIRTTSQALPAKKK